MQTKVLQQVKSRDQNAGMSFYAKYFSALSPMASNELQNDGRRNVKTDSGRKAKMITLTW
jgi:hypothetical protein